MQRKRERKRGRDAARRDADAPRIFGVACARPNRATAHSLFFSRRLIRRVCEFCPRDMSRRAEEHKTKNTLLREIEENPVFVEHRARFVKFLAVQTVIAVRKEKQFFLTTRALLFLLRNFVRMCKTNKYVCKIFRDICVYSAYIFCGIIALSHAACNDTISSTHILFWYLPVIR